ncbi:hypothetical protein BGZ80_006368 [Entomortierella chlamydospora]|uniref:Uncharacterized protein n=1 Tax=Entomortierella chlamydospora TaxID=101097 RepID=A0A9P6MHS2_9FUNG|nr:hypothetical protein BGZ80_006368 [Entomortierella chlamydospora]
MMHPWFRMVNPDRNTLKEPAEDPESGRPLLAEELDAEIILHMRWLLAPGPSHSAPGAKEVFDEEALLREIEEKVTNNEENMEKLFYHLLCQHKTELLENYSGDDTNSTVLDGPRRRADSFPNSAVSAPRSPRDSPITSPGSPLSPTTPVEPSPLTLNPLEAAVVRAASAAKIGGRTSSTTTQLTSRTLLTSESMVTKPRCKEAAVAAAAVAAVDSRNKQNNEPRPATARSSRRMPESVQVTSVKSRDIKAPEVATNKMKVSQPELQLESQQAVPQPQLEPVQCQVVAPKPVSPAMQHNPIVANADHEDTSAAKNNEASKAPESSTATVSDKRTVTQPSIESQVLSTQMTEAVSPSEAKSCVVPAVAESSDKPVVIASAVPSASPASEAATSNAPVTSKRLRRPILRPLDVKASARTTSMNVCVSPHSRKCSDGSSTPSTTPMSPSGPKRPWFARLFDFKPQPLTFRSNWSAVETQERLEAILKCLYQTNIQIECHKKPSFGIKCRYEGGVINNQQVKAVKFKVEVTEKTGYLTSSSSSMSNDSSVGSTSSHITSSSAVTAILATVDNHPNFQHHSNHSQSHLPAGYVPGAGAPDVISNRRASDGGSILSSAAAAVTSSLVAATRNPFHHLHNQHGNQQYSHHLHNRSTASSPVGTSSSTGFPPLPHPSTLPRRTVKVTLHQQQGANSTLKLIYEQLQAAWDQQTLIFEQQQQQQQQQQEQLSAVSLINGSEITLIASPLPATQKVQRGAAI